MKRNIMSYLNKIQSYRTAIKNLHWSASNMSEHKLMDDVDEKVADFQDELAEVAQGVYGQIKRNELKPRKYAIVNSKKMLADLMKDTKQFYSTIKRSNDCIGLRSVVETFIGDLGKFEYLLTLCLKEDIKARMIIENKFRSIIRENIEKAIIKEQIIKETIKKIKGNK